MTWAPPPGCACDLHAPTHGCRIHPAARECPVALVAGSASRTCGTLVQGGMAGYVAHLSVVHGKKPHREG
jgi:hypothetical protein